MSDEFRVLACVYVLLQFYISPTLYSLYIVCCSVSLIDVTPSFPYVKPLGKIRMNMLYTNLTFCWLK